MTDYEGDEDFWWMTAEEQKRLRYIHLLNHRVFDESSSSSPFDEESFHSLTEDGEPSSVLLRYPRQYIRSWRNRFSNENVHRSLVVYTNNIGGDSAIGPFLVDIDISLRIQTEQDHWSALEDATEVAQNVYTIATTTWGISPDEIRLYFSGHKGFHVEIKPSALRISGDVEHQIIQSQDTQNILIATLSNSTPPVYHNSANKSETVNIDVVYGTPRRPHLKHKFLRLAGSINVWDEWGRRNSARKTRIHPDELSRKQLTAIVARSQVGTVQP